MQVVGVLLKWLFGSYQAELIAGIEEEAKKRGISVLYLPGREINAPDSYARLFNRIYDLIDKEAIDGLIIPVTVMGQIKAREMEDYLDRFAPIPVITLSLEYKQGFSINIDNNSGFKLLMDHLVHQHGYTKFAFIHGPVDHSDAIKRHHIYKEALNSKNIPCDDNKTVYGDFAIQSGIEAVRTLLDERKFKLKKDIEVIVCSNDLMAIGVIQELEKLGHFVPEEVAVTGFDDIEESRHRFVPITTVRHPIRELGKEGVKAFDLKMEPEKLLPTLFIPRTTCGCAGYGSNSINITPPPGKKELKEYLLPEVRNIIFSSKLPNGDTSLLEKFINFFLRPLPGDIFPKIKSAVLNFFISWIRQWEGLEGWSEAVIFLENNLPPGQNGDRRKALFQYTHTILVDLSRKVEIIKNSKSRQMENRLGWVNGALKASPQLDDISIPLSQRLQDWLGISNCSIFLYTNPGDFIHNFEMLNSKKEKEGTGHKILKDFKSTIQTVLPRDKPCSLIIQALVLDTTNMGFCIMDYHKELRHEYYERLRLNISTVLNHSLTIIESERRNRKLKELQGKLIQSAHQAGMAQIAINVMHTIGNILNSAYIAIDEAKNRIKQSILHRFRKANKLLVDNQNKLQLFLQEDPQGKILPDYYMKLEKMLENENDEMMSDLKVLEEKIVDVTRVVDAQMELSEGIFISESINLVESLENSLFLKNEILQEAKIHLTKEYNNTDKYIIYCYQNKLLHILVKIIEFAIHGALKTSERIITIKLGYMNEQIRLTIANSGGGMEKKSLINLFQQNFVPPNWGADLDFHFVANSLSEIGACIKAESEGPGLGAAIIITFPVSKKNGSGMGAIKK